MIHPCVLLYYSYSTAYIPPALQIPNNLFGCLWLVMVVCVCLLVVCDVSESGNHYICIVALHSYQKKTHQWKPTRCLCVVFYEVVTCFDTTCLHELRMFEARMLFMEITNLRCSSLTRICLQSTDVLSSSTLLTNKVVI